MKQTLLAAMLAVMSLGSAAFAQDAAPGADSMRACAGPCARGDGERPKEVRREEALKRAAERFDAMDVNKDGVLTQDEMRAQRQARRGHKRGHQRAAQGQHEGHQH